MVRLALVVTSGLTARFLLRGQAAFLERMGFDVQIICSPGDDLETARRREGFVAVGIPMSRNISPLLDLMALARLYRFFRKSRLEIVNAGTPKAGLLGMLAARAARVPVRVYTLRGLRLETTSGWKRPILNLAERLTASSAHRIVCASESLRRRYLELGLAPESKTAVLAAGSSNGVDCERFHPDMASSSKTSDLRRRLDIPAGALIIGFVGRLTRDKGIEDLLRVFETRIAPYLGDCRLLIVGDFETGDPVMPDVSQELHRHPRIVMVGMVKDSAPYYGLMDVLAFPSYREGFPNAPLEAAASAVPVAAYAATGTVDAVVHATTGSLVPVGDRNALAEALITYLEDGELRRRHGAAGRLRAEAHFERTIVWHAWIDEYRRLLADRGVGEDQP